MNYFIDIAAMSINKVNEELCGDKTEYFRTDDGIIVVLSDGLGSGVKANILATLTSKIALTMLKEGMMIEEVVETITQTLPVCNVRKLAYSTFSIVKIYDNREAYIVEFDNPGIFFLRNGKIRELPYEEKIMNNRKIKETRITLEENDIMVLVSDGVIHAGVGKTLNLGWQWEHVAGYLEKIIKNHSSAKYIASSLLNACEDLYLNRPGDDTTVLALKVRKPEYSVLFSGPPEKKENDKVVINDLMKIKGKKIVCGGTAANITARELNTELKANFDIYDRNIPPTATIKDIDLVTEGVLTLNAAAEKLKNAKEGKDLSFLEQKDGASRLAKIILEDCTHLRMLVGKAVNPAHQNPNFPQELSIKLNILEDLKKAAEELGKIVTMEYY